MNGYAGTGKLLFEFILEAIAYLVGFLKDGTLRHYQMQVNEAPAARLTGSQFMKAYQALAVLANTGYDIRLFFFR